MFEESTVVINWLKYLKLSSLVGAGFFAGTLVKSKKTNSSNDLDYIALLWNLSGTKLSVNEISKLRKMYGSKGIADAIRELVERDLGRQNRNLESISNGAAIEDLDYETPIYTEDQMKAAELLKFFMDRDPKLSNPTISGKKPK